MNFAERVAAMRRGVQQHLGDDATYSHPDTPGATVLRVRWHTRIAVGGDLGDAGYTEFLDGVNRVHFNREELDQKGIILATGGELRFEEGHPLAGVVLILHEQEQITGPVLQTWTASKAA